MTGDQRTNPGNELSNEIAQLSVWEMVAAVVIIFPLLAGISLRVAGLKLVVLARLAREGVLVRNTLVQVPGADGLGLDLNRLLVALGLAGLSVWAAAQAVRSRRLRLQQAERRSVGRR